MILSVYGTNSPLLYPLDTFIRLRLVGLDSRSEEKSIERARSVVRCRFRTYIAGKSHRIRLSLSLSPLRIGHEHDDGRRGRDRQTHTCRSTDGCMQNPSCASLSLSLVLTEHRHDSLDTDRHGHRTPFFHSLLSVCVRHVCVCILFFILRRRTTRIVYIHTYTHIHTHSHTHTITSIRTPYT